MKKIIKPLSLLMSTFLLFGCSFGKAVDPNESNKPQEQQKEDEQKPEEQKPEEQKPEEQKPEEQKPEEQKPEEQKPEEQKPEEQKPEEEKPQEEKPEEEKPEEQKPEEEKPQEEKPEEEKPEEEKPEEEKPEEHVTHIDSNFDLVCDECGENLGPIHVKIDSDYFGKDATEETISQVTKIEGNNVSISGVRVKELELYEDDSSYESPFKLLAFRGGDSNNGELKFKEVKSKKLIINYLAKQGVAKQIDVFVNGEMKTDGSYSERENYTFCVVAHDTSLYYKRMSVTYEIPDDVDSEIVLKNYKVHDVYIESIAFEVDHLDSNRDLLCDYCDMFMPTIECFKDVLETKLVYTTPYGITPGEKDIEICEDNNPTAGNSIKVARQVSLRSGGIANITWDYSESEGLIREIKKLDDNYDLIKVNFSDTEILNFKLKLKSIQISDLIADYDELCSLYSEMYPDVALEYNISCRPTQFKYDAVPISYFSKLNIDENGYECVDYDPESKSYTGFKVNYYQNKFWCTTQGKIVYIAADNDFFVLADGERYINVYMGSGRSLANDYFPEIKLGNYIEIRGALDQYIGAFQMTFINNVRSLTETEKAKISEPTGYQVLEDEEINSWNIGVDNKQNFVVDGLMNSLKSVTGTYVPGTLINSAGKAVSSMSRNERYHFKIQVGEAQLNIAYDYHTSVSEDDPFFKKVNSIFSSSEPVTIKGMMMYEGDTIVSPIGSGDGTWNLKILNVEF